MTSIHIATQASRYVQARPEIRPGYTVRVHERIQEGSKERVQMFEGLVIAVHKGHVPTDATITVRRLVSGVGVEKVYSLHSPKIEQVEVKKVAKVRRAKLFFLRGRHGKSARLSERFTTANEFETVGGQEMGVEEAEGVEETEETNETEETEEVSETEGEEVETAEAVKETQAEETTADEQAEDKPASK